MTAIIRFPEIATKLDKQMRKLALEEQCGLRQFTARLGDKLGVSMDAVDSWRRGVRRIPDEQIDPLVRALGLVGRGGALSLAGSELAKGLRAARLRATSVLSWSERVDEGGIVLRVRQARYRGAGKLWGRIFLPFLDAADILHEHTADTPRRNFEELQQAVWSGNLDVGLGILATPRLNLRLWFFNSPVRYRLNGVALVSEVERLGGLDRVRLALSRRKERKKAFIPLVMRGEIGELYAKNHLGLKEVREIRSLRPEAFSEGLRAGCRSGDKRMCVAIVDEITCLSILDNLQGQGCLVLPLNPDLEDSRSLTPSFRLGICVSRNESVGHGKKSELAAFLQDSLPDHISGNARSIAHHYLHLRNIVRRLVDRALPGVSENEKTQWVARAFCLTAGSDSCAIEPPHWRAVLREAMAIDAIKHSRRS
jgi:hypothetical protein